MKRILFSASIVALAASCTNELELQNMQQEQVKTGITFSAADAATDAATRGEYEEGDNVWYPFWTAEKDLIKIYANNVKKGSLDWGDDIYKTNSKSYYTTYKATKSERFAQFVGNATTEILDFKDDVDAENPATFIAVYPSSVSGLNSKVTPNWEEGFNFTLNTGTVYDTQDQTNAKGQGVYTNNVKFAIAKGYPKADNQIAVGENVDLRFNRIHAGLVFSTKGINEYTKNLSDDKDNYESIFGKLKSVKIKSLGEGEIKDGQFVSKTGGNKASTLTAEGSTTTVNVDKKGNVTYETNYRGNKTSEITITMNNNSDGVEWNDDARAYAIITPVTRFNGWNEVLEVTYTFKNVTLTQNVETKNSWVSGTFYSVPAIDMSDYKYFVTNDNALVLGEGAKLSNIVNPSTKTIKWGSKNVAASSITKIVSDAILGDDVKILSKYFTGLTDIELNKEEKIAANTFDNIASNVKRLVMPKVTTIDENFCGENETTKFSNLKELNLESYSFPNSEINERLFNGMGTRNSVLEKVNIKGVTDMSSLFNKTRVITFENFTGLKKVEMGENVVVVQKAFSGCINLQNITGSFDLKTANATKAFEKAGQGSNAKNVFDPKNPDENLFSTIRLTNSYIPANAFNGATTIYYILDKDGNPLKPDYVGENAFFGAISLEYLNLSLAETINEGAFSGAKKFKAASEDDKNLLIVGVKEIEKDIFKGTAVVNVSFEAAEKLNAPAFADCENLKQVKIKQKIEPKVLSAVSDWNGVFGATSRNVELFINPVNEALFNKDKGTISLPYKNGNNPIDYAEIELHHIDDVNYDK